MSKNALVSSKRALSASDRENLFEDMHPLTQKVVQKFSDKALVGNAAMVLIRYDMGEVINEIRHSDELTDEEKTQELKKVAAYCNQESLSPSVLSDLGRVAETFDRNFIKEEVNKALSDGRFLQFSHFKELQKISSEKKRLALLDKVRKNSWSASQLSAEMQANDDVENTKFGGRKPAIPSSPNTAIHKLFSSVMKAGKYVDTLAVPLSGDFLSLDSDDISPKLISTVETTKECLEDTIDKFDEARKLLQTFLEHCLNNLNAEDEEVDEEYEAEIAAEADAQDSFDDEDEDYTPAEHDGKVVVSAKVSAVDTQPAKRKRGRPRRADVIVEESSIDFAPEVDEDDDNE